jgi:threonyl/alanyl tRNA synthetase-like protein
LPPDIIRSATNLVPPEVKDVRIVDIVGLDQQADAGTHVASTRQVGRIQVVKVENKGKGFRRLRTGSPIRRPFSDQLSGKLRPGTKEWANQRRRGNHA